MATIVLKYNSRNVMAQKALDYILSLGVFTRTDLTQMSASEKRARKAIKEIKEGKGIVCNTFDEFLEAVK